MAKRLISFCIALAVFPLVLGQLGPNVAGDSESNVQVVYATALSCTVAIFHMSPYSTHYGTTAEDTVGGSGIILNNGEILTCWHLFDGYQAGKIRIMRFMFNGTTEVREGEQVKVVAWDKTEDLCLLQVNPAFSAPYISIAMEKPRLGEDIIFTGHTQIRLTRLRLYRYLEGPMGVMLTPVYFGDSGGGVFNIHGELIGIVKICLMIQQPQVQATFYGYATPLNKIQEFMDERPRAN